MTGALVILAVTIAVGVILWLTHNPGPDGSEAEVRPADEAEECCGRHTVCERQAAAVAAPDYFDDEELDRYAGREPDSYTPEEIEEFRSVLYTLIPSDIFPWGASLTRRRIALPTILRDEWIMLCEDSDKTNL